MLSDPAASAWLAAGRPTIAAPLSEGRCGRCGHDGPTVVSSRVVSEKFTGFDAWPYGPARLCVPCAWAYSYTPSSAPAMLITTTGVDEYRHGADLLATLAGGALPAATAAVVPTARRRHLLPTAMWGHLAVDAFVVRWDQTAAQRLSDLAWLRCEMESLRGDQFKRIWHRLSEPTPPMALLSAQPKARWSATIAAWSQLQPWRSIPQLWAAAAVLTNRATQRS